MRDRHWHDSLLALAVALALVAGLPTELVAQRSASAAVGARQASPGPLVAPVARLNLVAETSPADTARRSVAPFLAGGALVGAMFGGLLAVSFHGSFCGPPGPGYTCSSTSLVSGAVIGAGVGVLAGWLLWALTNPAKSPSRGSS
jgi:hypothetical protein